MQPKVDRERRDLINLFPEKKMKRTGNKPCSLPAHEDYLGSRKRGEQGALFGGGSGTSLIQLFCTFSGYPPRLFGLLAFFFPVSRGRTYITRLACSSQRSAYMGPIRETESVIVCPGYGRFSAGPAQCCFIPVQWWSQLIQVGERAYDQPHYLCTCLPWFCSLFRLICCAPEQRHRGTEAFSNPLGLSD